MLPAMLEPTNSIVTATPLINNELDYEYITSAIAASGDPPCRQL